MKRNLQRGLIEVGFIMFLFYANLLMGKFERSEMGRNRGLVWALEDICTVSNLAIAAIAAFIGYVVFEALRSKT